MGLDFSGEKRRVVTDRQIALAASVVAVGAFDGVHRGHQDLIRAAVAEAAERRLPAVVWTFDPPPKVHFGRAARLMPLGEKLSRIAALGPDWIVVAPFTTRYAGRSAADFIADLARIAPARIHVGADFRFGAKQSGDVALLARHYALAQAKPTCCCAGETISSSRIRALRAAGAHDEAAALLAAPPPWQMLGAALSTTDIRHKDDHDVWN
ncbi:FAD synthetase family protein [Xinfangfangia pollutisoli]|uniref:FAD synthetase family protein n=1 Tax=Xinfangfangia pollutisoli TaxID=2865960 RepID=UPI001CD69FE9|nr:FAD synthetase family protein [Xinfangfangia pollutisoli]